MNSKKTNKSKHPDPFVDHWLVSFSKAKEKMWLASQQHSDGYIEGIKSAWEYWDLRNEAMDAVLNVERSGELREQNALVFEATFLLNLKDTVEFFKGFSFSLNWLLKNGHPKIACPVPTDNSTYTIYDAMVKNFGDIQRRIKDREITTYTALADYLIPKLNLSAAKANSLKSPKSRKTFDDQIRQMCRRHGLHFGKPGRPPKKKTVTHPPIA